MWLFLKTISRLYRRWNLSPIFPCTICGEPIYTNHAEHYRVKGPEECKGEWMKYNEVKEEKRSDETVL